MVRQMREGFLSRSVIFALLPLLFALPSLVQESDPIVAVLHARWCPDLTAQNPQHVCVTSGTVAGAVEFHLVVNFKPPKNIQPGGVYIVAVACNYIEAIEQTDLHEPYSNRWENVSGTGYDLDDPSQREQYEGDCSDPPEAYSQAVIFSSVPVWAYNCHNVAYKVRAQYTYTKMIVHGPEHMPPIEYVQVTPPPLEITVTFDNLTIDAEPFLLFLTPGESSHNLTINYSLSCAQKKRCSVTIDIYSSDGQLVWEETLEDIIAPGSYTYTWNGMNNQVMPERACPRGIYVYDLKVEGACPYDTDQLRSPYLKVVQTKSEFTGGSEDCEDPYAEPLKAIVSYMLEEEGGRKASMAKVEIYDGCSLGKLTEKAGGTETNPPGVQEIWNEVVFDNINDFPPTPYFVFLCIAKDDRADCDKEHRRKYAIPLNTRKKRKFIR